MSTSNKGNLKSLKQDNENRVLVSKALSSIETRVRLNTNFCDAFSSVFKFLCSCRNYKMRGFTRSKQWFLEKGKMKIKKELDIVNILTKLKRIDYLARTLLTFPQYCLLEFQSEDCLTETTNPD